MFKSFSKIQIYLIVLSIIGLIISAIASYIYIGGPKSISAMISGVIGMFVLHFIMYRILKEENNSK